MGGRHRNVYSHVSARLLFAWGCSWFSFPCRFSSCVLLTCSCSFRPDYPNAFKEAKLVLNAVENSNDRVENFTQIIGIFGMLRELVSDGKEPMEIFLHSVDDRTKFLQEAVRVPSFNSHARTASEANSGVTSSDMELSTLIPSSQAPREVSKRGRWSTTRIPSVPAEMTAPEGNAKRSQTCSFCHCPGHNRANCPDLRKLGTVVSANRWTQLLLNPPMHVNADQWINDKTLDDSFPARVVHLMLHKVYRISDERFAILVSGLNMTGHVIDEYDRVMRGRHVVEKFVRIGTRLVVEAVTVLDS